MSRLAYALAFVLLAAPWCVGPAGARQAPPPVPAQPATSRFDPRLVDLRRAAASWQLRGGPSRAVVDQVCLVPDEATFFEALASWDDRRWFPILIDDPELVLKFLHAFRPARVVRFSGKAADRPGDDWSRAVAAVGESWTAEDAPAGDRPRGDSVPDRLGKTPPGVVLGRPGSPALPGLAALAAGRFQPLVRFDAPKATHDPLSAEEIGPFCDALDSAVASAVPDHDRLGDSCDFLTLAGDYPYRYLGPKGAMAVDDRVGRDHEGRRWAFAGRLPGDARRGVYAAMCSLFLRPGPSALLFDSYSESAMPWKFWSLRIAGDRIAPIVPTTLVVGDSRATVGGWHEAFDPANRAGLVFVNTHGSPRIFHLAGGPAHAFDVMPSAPAAVSMIHSYSAADPADTNTIAGRWLAQGAFLYFGAMDEPFLNAFRLPAVVAELMAAGLPFSAAHRPMRDEPFGEPWKLVILGDPLYSITQAGALVGRTRDYSTGPGWTSYAKTPPPAPDAPELTRLAWSVNAALIAATAGAEDTSAGILAVLRSVDRARLDPAARAVYDDLLAVLLFQQGRIDALMAQAAAIPKDRRTAVVARLTLSAEMAGFDQAIARRDFERATAAWSRLARSAEDHEFIGILIGRVASLADTPSRRDAWRARLNATLGATSSPEIRQVVTAELKRLDDADRARPAR